MQRVMFFNLTPIGLGGMWQNISYVLSNQQDELEINLHLDDTNLQRFHDIMKCFAAPKYKLHIKEHEKIHYNDKPGEPWQDTLGGIRNNIVDTTDYKLYEIQTYACNYWHNYYPSKFTRKHGDYVCLYLQFTERNNIYNDNRNLTDRESIYIKETLNYNYIELGSHMSIEENCKLIAESKCCIGREGGWTHVAHTTKTDFYPVMNNEHQFLRWCHGGHNKYLKPFTHVENFESLCKEII
jgi:hypothetical protein